MPYTQDKTYRHDCTAAGATVALANTITHSLAGAQPIGVSFAFRNAGTADAYLAITGDAHVSAITIGAGETYVTGDFFSSTLPNLVGLIGADVYVTPVLRFRG